MKSNYEIIPRNELLNPKNYDIVLIDHYWRVTPEGDGIVYIANGLYSLQCNTNESITNRIKPSIPSKVELIPLAYVEASKLMDL